MMSRSGSAGIAPKSGWLRRLVKERRASTMVEFAIVGPVFFLFLLVVFEVAYDAYLQEVLDTAVQATARQVQTGTAQPTSEANLASGVLCPNALGLLNCNNLFVRVERLDNSAAACPGGNAAQDIYNATDGHIPVSNGQLNLSLYGGTSSGGAYAGPTNCQNGTGGFCVAGPSASGKPEFIILSAVYLAPSFLHRLVSNTVTYQGSVVRAVFSTSAFVTEGFTSTTTGLPKVVPC